MHPPIRAFLHRRLHPSSQSLDGEKSAGGASNLCSSLSAELGRLISEDRFVKAKSVLTEALTEKGDSPALLRELARIESKQGCHDAAAKHLAMAATLDPTNSVIASDYALSLKESGRESAAIAFISDLPNGLRSQVSICAILGNIYYAIGWYAHAVDAYGSPTRLRWREQFRWLASWWRCGWPLHVQNSGMWILENKVDDLWRQRSANRRALLEATGLFDSLNRAELEIQLDTSLVWLTTAEIRSNSVRLSRFSPRGLLIQFVLMWLVAAIIIRVVSITSALPGVAIGSLLIAEVGAVITFYLTRFVTYTIERETRVRFGRTIWLLLIYFGLSLILLFGAITLTGLVGILLMDLGITILFWLNPFYETLREMTKRRRRYFREFVIDSFFSILIDLDDPAKMLRVVDRKQWIATLEDSAIAIERFLPSYVGANDVAIREQVAGYAHKLAANIRLMASSIALPSRGVRQQVVEMLRQSVVGLAVDDFSALSNFRSTLPDRQSSRRHWALMELVRIIVAFVLLILLVAVLAVAKQRSMDQLAGAAVVTALIPILIGALFGPLRRGKDPESANTSLTDW